LFFFCFFITKTKEAFYEAPSANQSICGLSEWMSVMVESGSALDGKTNQPHDFCADNKETIIEFKKQVQKEMQDNNLQPQDLKKLLVQYLGGAVSKVLHDDDNKTGLEVKSKKHPQGWKAFGDGKLDDSFQNYIIEAVQASKSEVVQAFNMGMDFQKNESTTKLHEPVKLLVYPVSKIEDYIPETNTTKALLCLNGGLI
jgi:hypothetical protein